MTQQTARRAATGPSGRVWALCCLASLTLATGATYLLLAAHGGNAGGSEAVMGRARCNTACARAAAGIARVLVRWTAQHAGIAWTLASVMVGAVIAFGLMAYLEEGKRR